jgi:AmmeMemoRadiSam system protein B/AmmeMemoRadiSam system protein A
MPAVAGLYYPADPGELRTMVREKLNEARKWPQEPIALIVPHAGYSYSGAVAAAAIKQVEGLSCDSIVLLGVNHRVADFYRISIWSTGAYSTPLGLMPVDAELAHRIRSADPEHIIENDQVQQMEHSIEVELPFILEACGPKPIVPIMIGDPSWENCEALSQAIVASLQDRKALLIASTDMSHYPCYDDALNVDRQTLLAISSLDPMAVLENSRAWLSLGVENLACTLCGRGPVLTVLMAARELGANRATVLRYANSGDAPHGDKAQVVGYGAVMLWKDEAAPLDAEDGDTLLRVARDSLTHYLGEGSIPDAEISRSALLRPGAAFVTLKENGALRGCVGDLLNSQELYRTVQEMAVCAATKDARFPPVTAEELSKVELEISVLLRLQRVRDVDEIRIGEDGLYVLLAPRSGVLLPQVAVEQGWDRDEFLRQVCRKANIPPDAWDKGAILYRFSAQVFSESS